MPKITVRYNDRRLRCRALDKIYHELAELVAKAADISFTKLDIDFYPYPNSPVHSRAPLLAIEIETMGFPDRIDRMNAELPKWKAIVRAIPEVAALRIPEKKPLIWLKPIDPSGRHV